MLSSRVSQPPFPSTASKGTLELARIGKYEIVSRIGQGAMGEVYKAHDPVLNRFVAIKTMTAILTADDQLVERFRREAQSAARLNHVNIVTVSTSARSRAGSTWPWSSSRAWTSRK